MSDLIVEWARDIARADAFLPAPDGDRPTDRVTEAQPDNIPGGLGTSAQPARPVAEWACQRRRLPEPFSSCR
jgi:hypothetical protein